MRILVLLAVFAMLVGCGDTQNDFLSPEHKTVFLGELRMLDVVPSAPSVITYTVPAESITSVEYEYNNLRWIFTIYATHNDTDYVSTQQRWHGRSAHGFTELDENAIPVGSTRGYRVTWELGSDRIETVVYDRGNRYTNTHSINLKNFVLYDGEPPSIIPVPLPPQPPIVSPPPQTTPPPPEVPPPIQSTPVQTTPITTYPTTGFVAFEYQVVKDDTNKRQVLTRQGVPVKIDGYGQVYAHTPIIYTYSGSMPMNAPEEGQLVTIEGYQDNTADKVVSTIDESVVAESTQFSEIDGFFSSLDAQAAITATEEGTQIKFTITAENGVQYDQLTKYTSTKVKVAFGDTQDVAWENLQNLE